MCQKEPNAMYFENYYRTTTSFQKVFALDIAFDESASLMGTCPPDSRVLSIEPLRSRDPRLWSPYVCIHGSKVWGRGRPWFK